MKSLSPMDKVRDLRLSLVNAETEYLERNGWQLTCRTPGCYWLWSKDMPASGVAGVNWLMGKVLCDTKTALQLQAAIDEWFSPEEE